MEMTKDINRIKVVLVEKKRTNKWLAEQLGKDPATVSKWCTNTSQPGLIRSFINEEPASSSIISVMKYNFLTCSNIALM